MPPGATPPPPHPPRYASGSIQIVLLDIKGSLRNVSQSTSVKSIDLLDAPTAVHCNNSCSQRKQTLASTPAGMPGTHPPIFWLGGRQREYPPQYYYVLSDIAEQYWLPSVRSASSRFHSAIRRHQFASVRQADSRLTRLVPPTLNSR